MVMLSSNLFLSNSKEMLHYIEPTLETGFYDITRAIV